MTEGRSIVIDVDFKRTANLVLKKPPWKSRGCFHASLTIDEGDLSTVCNKCGQKFEPFAALVHLVGDLDRFSKEEDRLRVECERLERERDDLQRDIKNLKAQKRRAVKPC